MSKNHKPKYSLIQNILFLMAHLWKNNRSIFTFAGIQVLSALGISLLSVYLPKITLDGIASQWNWNTIVISIGSLSILIAILNFFQARTSAEFEVIQNINRYHFMNEVEKVIMTCDYSEVENPNIQVKMEQAGDIVFTGNYYTGLNGLANGSRDMLGNLLNFFVFGLILTGLSPIVVGVLFATSLIGSFVANRIAVYEHVNRDQWSAIDKKIEYIHKNLTDTGKGKDIRIYQCLEWFHQVLDKQVIERLVWLKRVMNRQFGGSICDAFLLFLRDGIGIGWIVTSVINQKIGVGDFMLYFGSISQFSGYVTKMMNGMNHLKKSSLDVCVLRDFLEMKDENPKRAGKPLPTENELPVSITFDHVSFCYPNTTKEILSDIDFTIQKGEKMALVGSNGAGKTTLIKLLCGFYQPTKGQILINATPLRDFSKEDTYKLFSALFQDIMVLPFSVAQNIAMVEEDKINKAKVKESIALVGLEERLPNIELKMVKAAFDNGIELSGGESQRLLLARAIYKDAPVLVLDEPSAALDPIAENQLYLQYNQLTKGKTSIFISHRLASTSFCDRIIFLEDGKVAELGTHKQLLQNAKSYAAMYTVQSSYYKGGSVKHE